MFANLDAGVSLQTKFLACGDTPEFWKENKPACDCILKVCGSSFSSRCFSSWDPSLELRDLQSPDPILRPSHLSGFNTIPSTLQCPFNYSQSLKVQRILTQAIKLWSGREPILLGWEVGIEKGRKTGKVDPNEVQTEKGEEYFREHENNFHYSRAKSFQTSQCH